MTKNAESPRLRYDEGCLAVHALNQIGDRWALLVVRELMFTPKRFQMIRAGLPGITAGVLVARLAQLRDAGIVTHDDDLAVYSLTAAGQELLPVLEALCRWALIIPGHDPTRFISPTALMISMGVNLRRDEAQGRTVQAGFDFGKEAFEIRLDNGEMQTRAVSHVQAPFVLKADGNAMAAAVYGNKPLAQLQTKGFIEIQGDRVAAQAFVDLFTLARRT